MKFRIKSLQAQGGVTLTVLDAVDADEAARLAASQGLAVISVSRAPPLGRLRAGAGTGFSVLLFSRELLSLLDSGISVVEAVETLAEKEDRQAVRQLLEQMVTGLHQGLSLSAVLERHPQAFTPLYVATIRSSERTGALGEALGRYVAYATQLDLLRGRLVSAAIYPVLLLCVSALVILFLMAYVVPRFAHIYEDMGGDMPLMTRVLLQWGQTWEQHGHWLPVLLALAAVVLVRGGGRALGRWTARTLWRLPGVGERMRLYQLARLYRTLGMLLRGGIPITTALEMVRGLLSAGLRAGLDGALRDVRQGRSMSDALQSGGLTSSVALRMLRVGERAGNMGEMMERIAAFHDEEMARWADWATRLIGPVLMLLIGVLIGGIVILMYLPIFQLTEGLR